MASASLGSPAMSVLGWAGSRMCCHGTGLLCSDADNTILDYCKGPAMVQGVCTGHSGGELAGTAKGAQTSDGSRDGTSRSKRERQSTRVLLILYNEKNQGWICYYV